MKCPDTAPDSVKKKWDRVPDSAQSYWHLRDLAIRAQLLLQKTAPRTAKRKKVRR